MQTNLYRIRTSLLRFSGSAFVNLILLSGALLCILPIVHILAVSFSESTAANANLVGIIPIGFNIRSYIEAFDDSQMVLAIGQSIKRILLGVSVNMVLTILCAYPLSFDKNDFPMRSGYSAYVVFTMLFSGGLIPSYILINRLHLMNSFWALVLPGIPVYNVIIMMNFFRQINKEIREAASIDGAGHFTILTRIILPMSGPVIATLIMFCLVGHWNAWFDALIYLKDQAKYPLQNYLRILISRLTQSMSMDEARRLAFISRRSLLFAKIVISLIPIMIIYPFLQKHFKSGIVVGAVKG
jgi:putative aldouronate transport system permease protein